MKWLNRKDSTTRRSRSANESDRPIGSPCSGLATEMHDRHDNYLIRFGIDAVNHSVRKSMQPTAPVGVIQRLPGLGMFNNSIDSPAKFVQEFATQGRLERMIAFKGGLKVVVSVLEKQDVHGRAPRRMRSITSSTGRAEVFPAAKSASRRCASFSQAASTASRSALLMLSRRSSANASRSLGSSAMAADLICSFVSAIDGPPVGVRNGSISSRFRPVTCRMGEQ
jgi:hypothetical protein